MIHGAMRRRGYKAASAAILAMTTTLAGAAVMPAAATASPAKASASQAAPASAHQGYSAPISGKAEGHDVTGTFTPRAFHLEHGRLVATGQLRGTIDGVGDFRRTVTMEVQHATVGGAASGGRFAGAAAGSCEILNLVLGPLDLDLLGLQVHLDQVVLDITAQQGAGNLLGNLLCAVAGLLDNNGILGGLLTQLNDLLNQILGVLGNL